MRSIARIYKVLWALVLMTTTLCAQDKIFFKNGKAVHGKILSIAEHTISYRDSTHLDSVQTVPKADVLLAEYENGTLFIFGHDKPAEQPVQQPEQPWNETREQRKARMMKQWKDYESTLSDHILGFYIPELFMGRFTVSYERLLANKSIGVKIPVSLTYSVFNQNNKDSLSGNYNPRKGVNFITGVDLSYYTDMRPHVKYFVGPRIRYGTDMTLGGLTGYTFQLQNGILKNRSDHIITSFSMGFGFFKPTVPITGNTDFFYPWMSLNWCLGFRL